MVSRAPASRATGNPNVPIGEKLGVNASPSALMTTPNPNLSSIQVGNEGNNSDLSSMREQSEKEAFDRARKGKAVAGDEEQPIAEVTAIRALGENPPVLVAGEEATKAEVKPERSYASLFQSNQHVASSMKLDFHPEVTKGDVKLSKEDVELAGSYCD